MIFQTVYVEPAGDVWRVRYDKSSTIDRDGGDLRSPLALGFYHYPKTMDDLEAKRLLIQCMIERHTEEIDRLTKSKSALIDLLGQG